MTGVSGDCPFNPVERLDFGTFCCELYDAIIFSGLTPEVLRLVTRMSVDCWTFGLQKTPFRIFEA